MLLEVIPVGALKCNCSIYACEKTKEAVIIDPGDEPDRILEVVRHYDLKVKALLHTHAHLDHVGATAAVKRETGAEVWLHEGDSWLYDNVAMQGALFGFATDPTSPVDRFPVDGDRCAFGDGFAFTVLHTPGHTPGSVCFKFSKDDAPIFSGDTLFRRGIGRTDLWGGSYETIIASIRERLFTLNEETVVVPGHGPTTRIGEERAKNPFFK